MRSKLAEAFTYLLLYGGAAAMIFAPLYAALSLIEPSAGYACFILGLLALWGGMRLDIRYGTVSGDVCADLPRD